MSDTWTPEQMAEMNAEELLRTALFFRSMLASAEKVERKQNKLIFEAETRADEAEKRARRLERQLTKRKQPVVTVKLTQVLPATCPSCDAIIPGDPDPKKDAGEITELITDMLTKKHPKKK